MTYNNCQAFYKIRFPHLVLEDDNKSCLIRIKYTHFTINKLHKPIPVLIR